jgi:hypothetical protein
MGQPVKRRPVTGAAQPAEGKDFASEAIAFCMAGACHQGRFASLLAGKRERAFSPCPRLPRVPLQGVPATLQGAGDFPRWPPSGFTLRRPTLPRPAHRVNFRAGGGFFRFTASIPFASLFSRPRCAASRPTGSPMERCIRIVHFCSPRDLKTALIVRCHTICAQTRATGDCIPYVRTSRTSPPTGLCPPESRIFPFGRLYRPNSARNKIQLAGPPRPYCRGLSP